MTTAIKGKGLHAKLAEVMAEVERIPKNGTAPAQMGGFKFVQVGDAADAIRAALGSRGVSMLPSAVEVISESEHPTKSGGTMTTQTIRTTWTLVDGESGDTAVIQSLGTGADTGDKFSPKAQSNAMKYALLMGFMLSTGDDPEQHDTSDRQARQTTQSGAETLEMLGRIQKTGKVEKGGASAYQGEWREGPGGHVIGFKLKLAGEDRDIPQVLVNGPIGEALFIGHPSILGEQVTVKGHLYNVKQPGRTAYYRLVVGERPEDWIETSDLRIPPLPDPEQDAVNAVAPGQESFDLAESARIDAEAAAIG